ncbi:hypothetical protein CROQUDRAFT_36431 [Cronartium quercuum f. sp. fusiforme G11]|uniref:DNL-type domain-containing protein n=1 Tax=Cronartium quercuum f. sp. fusiforme G11 TaxID=708437 RepID=A0A9P6THF8_9BASI|nr:hypothetical protein CROQUDRAFT_36431 [Cronartium quercuum f. sp. fusiforme G11]
MFFRSYSTLQNIIKPRIRIQFTCTAIIPSSSSQTCQHQNTHEFSKHAYERGIVLVQCPSCKNRHLIADHLQWFTNNPTADDPHFSGNHRTIVDLMRAKGEKVKRGKVGTEEGGVLEFYDDDDDHQHHHQ